jgi:hypothetical protein
MRMPMVVDLYVLISSRLELVKKILCSFQNKIGLPHGFYTVWNVVAKTSYQYLNANVVFKYMLIQKREVHVFFALTT